MKKIIFLFLLISFFMDSSVTLAKDLGVFGETFEIKEKDLLDHIRIRLFQMQKDGSLEAENRKIKEKILANVKTPKPIASIKHTEVERTFEYDPTIELTQDLADHKGRVFAKKGDRFNPLDKITLSKPLLFIDGDDEKHVKWAIAKINGNNPGGDARLCRIILIKGSPLDLQEQLKRDIYFDQHGILTNKLGIKHVPAIVLQEKGKKVLTITEEAIVPETLEKK